MITEKKVSIDLKRLINENHIYESGNIEYKRARNELPRDFGKHIRHLLILLVDILY